MRLCENDVVTLIIVVQWNVTEGPPSTQSRWQWPSTAGQCNPPQFTLVSRFPISQSDRVSMRYAGSPIQIGTILYQRASEKTPSPPWCQTQTGTTCLMGLGSVWALLRSLLSSCGSVTGRTVLPSRSCCYEGCTWAQSHFQSVHILLIVRCHLIWNTGCKPLGGCSDSNQGNNNRIK